MKTVNHFSELDGGSTGQSNLGVFNTERIENAPIGGVGGTPPVTSAQSAGDAPPNTPQWRKTVNERLGNLEWNMKQGFDGINAKLKKLLGE